MGVKRKGLGWRGGEKGYVNLCPCCVPCLGGGLMAGTAMQAFVAATASSFIHSPDEEDDGKVGVGVDVVYGGGGMLSCRQYNGTFLIGA